MSRPVVVPDWATGVNYPAGADPWSGTPIKSQPSAGKVTNGYTPNTDDAAEEDNFLLNNHAEWINHLRATWVFQDDFDGATFEDRWVVSATTGTITTVNDAATFGGIGAAKFLGTGGVTLLQLQSNFLTVLGVSQDFYWRARVRAVDDNSVANYSTDVGLFGDSTHGAFLIYTSATSVWTVITPGGMSQALDIGSTSGYQMIEMWRTNGVISVMIDGVLKYTATDTASVTVKPTIHVSDSNHTITFNVDLFHYMVKR